MAPLLLGGSRWGPTSSSTPPPLPKFRERGAQRSSTSTLFPCTSPIIYPPNKWAWLGDLSRLGGCDLKVRQRENCLMPHPSSGTVPVRPESSHSWRGIATLNILPRLVFATTKSFLAGGWKDRTFPHALLWVRSLRPPEVARLHRLPSLSGPLTPLANTVRVARQPARGPGDLVFGMTSTLSPLPSTVMVRIRVRSWQMGVQGSGKCHPHSEVHPTTATCLN